jgi:hypothetical protein
LKASFFQLLKDSMVHQKLIPLERVDIIAGHYDNKHRKIVAFREKNRLNKITQIAFAGALLTISATCAAAATISFDDAYAASVFNPATYYKALDGVTISGTYTGVIGGVGNGDPGNLGPRRYERISVSGLQSGQQLCIDFHLRHGCQFCVTRSRVTEWQYGRFHRERILVGVAGGHRLVLHYGHGRDRQVADRFV